MKSATRLSNHARRLRKASRLARSPRFRGALRRGVGATLEHRHLDRFNVRTVLDIGANRGQFSLLALEIFPDAEVYAFEPLRTEYAVAQQVLGREPRWHGHQVAIGEAVEELTMHVAGAADSSSLLPIGPEQTRLHPQTRESGRETVKVVPLHHVVAADQLHRPVLMKIDVQGFEAAVIRGSAGLLEHVDVVYCECSFRELYVGQPLATDIISLLTDAGFAWTGLHDVAYEGGTAVQADFVFERPSA
jgi:FkbM family methyltransferase